MFERALVSLEAGAAGAVFRMGIGYLIVPAWLYASPRHDSGWSLVLFFLAVLLSLRVVPALFRKVLPFSRPVRDIWAERRQIAKRFDSYQWRKLLWIGAGLALFALQSGVRAPAQAALASGSVVAGAIGALTWRHRVVRRQVRRVP